MAALVIMIIIEFEYSESLNHHASGSHWIARTKFGVLSLSSSAQGNYYDSDTT